MHDPRRRIRKGEKPISNGEGGEAQHLGDFKLAWATWDIRSVENDGFLERMSPWCSHGTWWIIRSTLQTHFRLVFSSWAVQKAILSPSEAHPSASAGTFTNLPDMTLHPLWLSASQAEPAARDKRAPPEPSIVGWFCRLPWLESVADSVAPDACHLVLEAAKRHPQRGMRTRHT